MSKYVRQEYTPEYFTFITDIVIPEGERAQSDTFFTRKEYLKRVIEPRPFVGDKPAPPKHDGKFELSRRIQVRQRWVTIGDPKTDDIVYRDTINKILEEAREYQARFQQQYDLDPRRKQTPSRQLELQFREPMSPPLLRGRSMSSAERRNAALGSKK